MSPAHLLPRSSPAQSQQRERKTDGPSATKNVVRIELQPQMPLHREVHSSDDVLPESHAVPQRSRNRFSPRGAHPLDTVAVRDVAALPSARPNLPPTHLRKLDRSHMRKPSSFASARTAARTQSPPPLRGSSRWPHSGDGVFQRDHRAL